MGFLFASLVVCLFGFFFVFPKDRSIFNRTKYGKSYGLYIREAEIGDHNET